MKNMKPRETNQSDEQCIQVYGVDREGLIDLFNQACTPTADSIQMLAMSILSDAQHVLEYSPEVACKYINKAKWLMSHVHEVIHDKMMEEYK